MKPLKLPGLLLILLSLGCVKDEVKVEDLSYNIEPEFGVPIANASIKAEKVIEHFDDDGLVQEEENSSLSLIYLDTLNTIQASRFLQIDDEDYSENFSLTALEYATLLGSGSVTISDTKFYELSTGEGDKLDSVRFESGLFNLNIESNGPFPISGSVVFRNSDGSEALSLSFEDETPPVSIQQEMSFEERLFLFINSETLDNGIEVEYEITFTSEPGQDGGDEVQIDIGLSDLSIKSAGGYIAPRSLELDDEDVDINIFEQQRNADISIEDPRFHFYFDNGFGMGLGLEVNSLYGLNALGDSMAVEGENIQQLPFIQGAPSPGDVVSSKLSITNETVIPNLTDFIEFQPNYVSGNFNLLVNPENQQSVFISSQSELDVQFEAEMPIYGSVANFRLTDTTEVNLDDLLEATDDAAEVEELNVRLIVDNGLPLDAGTQIIFVDDQFNPIDSLFEAPDFVFTSAPVDFISNRDDPDFGRATGKTRTITDIEIPRERIDALENATQIIVKVFGHTTSNGENPIRLFSGDSFDFKLAARAKLSFDNE
jgi:hypothetical protein